METIDVLTWDLNDGSPWQEIKAIIHFQNQPSEGECHQTCVLYSIALLSLNPLHLTCRSVLEQETEPQIAPDAAPSVYECARMA